jgi:hypothetical protein
MGTLLNLAICHENVGRIASAWGEFRAVEQQARAANRDDRVKLAHDRAAKLEPRLPRIKIVVPADAQATGLVVKVDGEVKGEPLWSGVAVDPGTRSVEASAPGKKPTVLKVKIDDEGVVVPVTVPKLEPAPEANDAHGDRDRADAYAANRSRRTTGYVVLGTGVATVAVGGVFGVLAILANNDAPQACPRPCVAGSPQANNADASTDRALLFANVTNVVLPLGAIIAAIGGYMVLTAGPTDRPVSTTERKGRPFFASHPGGARLGLSW